MSVDLAPEAVTSAPSAAAWSERTVSLDGVEHRYWEAGSGAPLVVLHGGGGPDLAPAYLALAAANHVTYLELPGFGESFVDPGVRTYHEMARLVTRILDAIGLERFALLGVSFGGATAAWIAADAPDRIDRLVLVAPASLRSPTRLPMLDPEGIETALRSHPERGGPEPAAPDVAQRRFGLVQAIWSASNDDALRGALVGLPVPTLIVFGTEDGLVPAETGREYRRLLPRSTLALVYDAAHEVAWDRPEAFTELVADFLVRADAHVVSRTSRLVNR